MGSDVVTRLTWDEYFLSLAYAVSLRADCTRRKVGAVIVNTDHRVLGIGYNGAPPGKPGCLTQKACPRGQRTKDEVLPGSSYDTGPGSCIAVHAEINAILDAGGRAGCMGARMYCNEMPCDGCLRIIEAAGIVVVVHPQGDFQC